MFERKVDYPTAVASYDDEGVDAAIDWCCEYMDDGDTLTVWTSQKSNLRNCEKLERLVKGHSSVQHVTSRGGGYIRGRGPVLMAWPDMDDLGQLPNHGSNNIRALCVITWNDEAIRPWVSAVSPQVLGDGSSWDNLAPSLDPVVVEAIRSLTLTINHNNTISAGFEKEMVVGALLALHRAGIAMDGAAMQGWALAHGWSGQNPERLARYVEDINAGKRPRCRSAPGPDYIAELRRRAAER